MFRYSVDFSARPATDSIDIRKNIEKVAWNGYLQKGNNVTIGEFYLERESDLALLDFPDWVVCHRL